jgi:hypothetical protein
MIFWWLVVRTHLGETIRNSAVVHSYDGTTQILNHIMHEMALVAAG